MTERKGANPLQYTEGEEWLEALLAYLKENAEYIAALITERMPRVKYHIPEATYLAWLDFRALDMSDEALWHFMRHEAKVATDNGVMLGLNGEGRGFQRLNFACPRSQLSEALNRIADALDTRFLYNNRLAYAEYYEWLDQATQTRDAYLARRLSEEDALKAIRKS